MQMIRSYTPIFFTWCSVCLSIKYKQSHWVFHFGCRKSKAISLTLPQHEKDSWELGVWETSQLAICLTCKQGPELDTQTQNKSKIAVIPVLRGWKQKGKFPRLSSLVYLVSFKPVKDLGGGGGKKQKNKNWPSEIAKWGKAFTTKLDQSPGSLRWREKTGSCKLFSDFYMECTKVTEKQKHPTLSPGLHTHTTLHHTHPYLKWKDTSSLSSLPTLSFSLFK